MATRSKFTSSLALSFLLFTGCLRPADLHTVVNNPRGVEQGAPVIFQDQKIGAVAKVVAVDTGFHAGFHNPHYRKTFRGDLKAYPVRNCKTSNFLPLILIGEKDLATMIFPIMMKHQQWWWKAYLTGNIGVLFIIKNADLVKNTGNIHEKQALARRVRKG